MKQDLAAIDAAQWFLFLLFFYFLYSVFSQDDCCI